MVLSGRTIEEKLDICQDSVRKTGLRSGVLICLS